MNTNHSQTVGFVFPHQNPLGDAVSERCREVIGRHNTSLEVLDIHNARMSTPAVSSVRMYKHCLPASVHESHIPLDYLTIIHLYSLIVFLRVTLSWAYSYRVPT